MRFCRIPSLIAAALFAIGANGAVNVTASRDYVDRRLTSVSNSIMEEVSSSLINKADKSDLEAHVWDYGNPHVVTAEQTEAVPLVEDSNGEKTAVTIGSRAGTVGPYSLANGNNVTASGSHSHAEGRETKATASYSHAEGDNNFAKGLGSHAEGFVTTASGEYSHSEGYGTIASGDYSHAGGHDSMTRPGDSDSFAWSGIVQEDDTKYSSHGQGTFNVNPISGANGFYIGEKTLSETISDGVAGKADKTNVYTKAESDARISAVSNRAEEAYSAAEDMVDAVNSLAGTLGTHTRDTTNPHKVTAAQVGAVQLVKDVNSNKTAVTIGNRNEDGTVGVHSLANGSDVTASGNYSHAEGNNTTASGESSHAEGNGTIASGGYSHAEGRVTVASGAYSHADGFLSQTLEYDDYAYSWNGDGTRIFPYHSHGSGTFNINPVGGTDGFYIGEKKLSDVISGIVTNNISADNQTFSNAVLAVGLNIDTNSVAVLNEIAETFGGFPLGAGETATTIGGLLAALAAAVAWLKKNKVGAFASVGGASATVENGVAKLDDFFTESNSLLTGLIESKTRGKADQSDLDALAAKVDTANAALEEVA